MELPDLERYNIGLGSASKRTPAQKARAIKYTNHVVAQIPKNRAIIYTDGSVLDNEGQKGGCGGSLTKNTGNKWSETASFSKTIKTGDAQVTELHGVLEAVRLINTEEKQINKKEMIYHILCDCRNVTKYVKDQFQPPTAYAKILTDIQCQIRTLQSQNTTYAQNIKIHWIPGHTGHNGNERADELAKKAARGELHEGPREHGQVPLPRQAVDGHPPRAPQQIGPHT